MKKHYEAVPVEEAAKIAQWVIDNRYPKPGKERMTDTEMYHLLKDKIEQLQPEVGSSVSTGVKENLREQFKKERPETIGETDKAFDDLNYIEWLETRATNSTEDIIEMIDEEMLKYEKKIKDSQIGSATALANMAYNALYELRSRITAKEKPLNTHNP